MVQVVVAGLVLEQTTIGQTAVLLLVVLAEYPHAEETVDSVAAVVHITAVVAVVDTPVETADRLETLVVVAVGRTTMALTKPTQLMYAKTTVKLKSHISCRK